jgi:hypothetical protein
LPLEIASTDRIENKQGNRVKNATAKMVRAKRSFHNFFKRGDRSSKTPEPVAPRQGFMSDTRSSLAKVIRDSKSMSTVNVSRGAESRSETGPGNSVNKAFVAVSPVQDTLHPPTLAVLEAPSPSPLQNVTSAHIDAAGTAIYNILDGVETLPRESPERLRAMEIAEVSKTLRNHAVVLSELLLTTKITQCVINAAQCSRNANVNAIEAKMHAREAQLFSERAAVEVTRLQQLCEDVDFDARTMKVVKGLIKNAGLTVLKDELREGTSAEN